MTFTIQIITFIFITIGKFINTLTISQVIFPFTFINITISIVIDNNLTDNMWVAGGAINNGGMILRWVRDKVCHYTPHHLPRCICQNGSVGRFPSYLHIGHHYNIA